MPCMGWPSFVGSPHRSRDGEARQPPARPSAPPTRSGWRLAAADAGLDAEGHRPERPHRPATRGHDDFAHGHDAPLDHDYNDDPDHGPDPVLLGAVRLLRLRKPA